MTTTMMMKKRKSHLALAAALLALAATAQAQTSKVSLYGLIDASAGSSKAPGGAAIKSADSGKMSTSYFGLSGTEDLGGGLSAFFTIDSFMRADVGNSGRFNGDNFWARNAYVGLKSDAFGTIRAGGAEIGVPVEIPEIAPGGVAAEDPRGANAALGARIAAHLVGAGVALLGAMREARAG